MVTGTCSAPLPRPFLAVAVTLTIRGGLAGQVGRPLAGDTFQPATERVLAQPGAQLADEGGDDVFEEVGLLDPGGGPAPRIRLFTMTPNGQAGRPRRPRA